MPQRIGKQERQAIIMNKEERRNIIRTVIASGIGVAGISAFIKNLKAMKSRAKNEDARDSKNAIVVQIKKDKFMEGVKTPREVAALNGDVSHKDSVPEIAAADLPSVKRDILRSNGKKLDFFGGIGKNAEKSKADEGGDKPEKPDGGDEEKAQQDKKVTREEVDGRVICRGHDGRFLSPTDPVAVEYAEKEAGVLDEVVDTVIHPVDSASMIWNSAKTKPIYYSAAALGSIYLATMLADGLSKLRRKRAKERTEIARNDYISLLEATNEKRASNDIREWAGSVLGGSFVVPMVLAAMVTNKVIENRRKKEDKKKEVANSYPEEPLILYKTADGRDIRMSPEAALALISIKRNTIMASDEMEKTSQDRIGNFLKNQKKRTMEAFKNTPLSDEAIGKMADDVMSLFSMPKNAKHLQNLIMAYRDTSSKDREGKMQDALTSMIQELPESERLRVAGNLAPLIGNKEARRAVLGTVMSNSAFGDRMADYVANRKYDDVWGKFRQEMANDKLTFGGRIQKGGILHTILSWLVRTFGLDRYFARNMVKDKFKEQGDKWNSEVRAAKAEAARREKALAKAMNNEEAELEAARMANAEDAEREMARAEAMKNEDKEMEAARKANADAVESARKDAIANAYKMRESPKEYARAYAKAAPYLNMENTVAPLPTPEDISKYRRTLEEFKRDGGSLDPEKYRDRWTELQEQSDWAPELFASLESPEARSRRAMDKLNDYDFMTGSHPKDYAELYGAVGRSVPNMPTEGDNAPTPPELQERLSKNPEYAKDQIEAFRNSGITDREEYRQKYKALHDRFGEVVPELFEGDAAVPSPTWREWVTEYQSAPPFGKGHGDSRYYHVPHEEDGSWQIMTDLARQDPSVGDFLRRELIRRNFPQGPSSTETLFTPYETREQAAARMNQTGNEYMRAAARDRVNASLRGEADQEKAFRERDAGTKKWIERQSEPVPPRPLPPKPAPAPAKPAAPANKDDEIKFLPSFFYLPGSR